MPERPVVLKDCSRLSSATRQIIRARVAAKAAYTKRLETLENAREKLYEEWEKKVLDPGARYEKYADAPKHQEYLRGELARPLANLEVNVWMGQQLMNNIRPDALLAAAHERATTADAAAEGHERKAGVLYGRWIKNTDVNTSQYPKVNVDWNLILRMHMDQEVAQGDYERQRSARYTSMNQLLRAGKTVEDVACVFGNYTIVPS